MNDCRTNSISNIIFWTLVPEEDPVEGWNMLYQKTIKQNLNVSVIGGCDCKNLAHEWFVELIVEWNGTNVLDH